MLRLGSVLIRVQLLRAEGRPTWPTEVVDLHQRYTSAPNARMRVPTLDSFAASKLSTWLDRRAPRDLHDMWALGRRGLIRPQAAELFGRHGIFTAVPDDKTFFTAPAEHEWVTSLANQTRLSITAQQAAAEVARLWAEARAGQQRPANP